jgi:hypothetical protein
LPQLLDGVFTEASDTLREEVYQEYVDNPYISSQTASTKASTADASEAGPAVDEAMEGNPPRGVVGGGEPGAERSRTNTKRVT